jgi:hypothetical protein
MSFNKIIQSTSKLKKLENRILTANSPRAYLFGVVLTSIGENSTVPVDEKAEVYNKACNEIDRVVKLHNEGEFKLDSTMVKFAFAIVEKLITSEVELNEHSQFETARRRDPRRTSFKI